MRSRALLLVAILVSGYFAFRQPVTATFVTDQGHFVLAQATFSSSCMSVVRSLKRKEALSVSDPWGVEHTVVAASCDRGNHNIGRAALDEAAIEAATETEQ